MQCSLVENVSPEFRDRKSISSTKGLYINFQLRKRNGLNTCFELQSNYTEAETGKQTSPIRFVEDILSHVCIKNLVELSVSNFPKLTLIKFIL